MTKTRPTLSQMEECSKDVKTEIIAAALLNAADSYRCGLLMTMLAYNYALGVDSYLKLKVKMAILLDT